MGSRLASPSPPQPQAAATATATEAAITHTNFLLRHIIVPLYRLPQVNGSWCGVNAAE
jgi:hypothetical protein